jgi:excisionase family DNA binding protein
MTMPAHAEVDRPFTLDTLAARWACSEGTIRKMIKRGELQAFRIGILFRIPADEVKRIECQNLTASSDSGAALPSSMTTLPESADAAGSTPKIGRARRPRPGESGPGATILPGRWEDS